MKFDWNVMIILFGIVQGMFILYTIVAKNKIRNYLPLVFWICILLSLLLESFLVRSGIIQYVIHVFKVPTPFIFLLGPLLYEHIVVQIGGKINVKHRVLHYLPCAFYFLYSFNFFLQSYEYKFNIIARDFHMDWVSLPVTQRFLVDPWDINGWIIVEIIVLHLVIYSILGYVKILRDKSNAAKKWLLYLNTVMLISALVLFFAQGGVIDGTVFLKSPFPHYSPSIFVTVAIYSMTFYLIINPDLLATKKQKYLKSSLSEDYRREKLLMLTNLIEGEHLYLSQDFSLKFLAERSGLSTHNISQILNEEMEYTFFELVNHYRINEAKKRLSHVEEHIKIDQLAYDLGYKSKSTFYSAFKKDTKLTPSQYRESISRLD